MQLNSFTPARTLNSRWILFSAVGLSLGITLSLGLSDPIEALVGMMLVTPIIMGLAGTFFGTSQWLAVNKWNRTAWYWILATAAGIGVGMTTGLVVVEVVGRALTGEQMRLITIGVGERVVGLLVIGLFTGTSVGLAQQIVLRRLSHCPRQWILYCMAAFATGFPLGALLSDLLIGGIQSPIGFISFLAFTGLIVGAITALAVKQSMFELKRASDNRGKTN